MAINGVSGNIFEIGNNHIFTAFNSAIAVRKIYLAKACHSNRVFTTVIPDNSYAAEPITQRLITRMNYQTPDNIARFEQVIKKSRFIAVSTHAPDRAGLNDLLNKLSAEFPDAGHICYAGILGAPEAGKLLYSDDSEPAGTAGKPILNVLQHSGFGDIATAVVRYFGGTKLGAGGLVRAYSGSASGSVKQLTTRTVEQTVHLVLEAQFPLENDIRHLLNEFGVGRLNVGYKHNLQIQCSIPVALVDQLRSRLNDACRGKMVFTILDPE